MELTFNGAAQTVTGSQYLLKVNGKQLLLECGLFQGKRADTYTRNQTFGFDPAKIDALILSHAHIDHSGNLPNLVKQGYSGPIYTTDATAHLADVMLRDSGHIQEADVVFVNKKRARRGEPPVEPLYTAEDAARVSPLFRARRYHEQFEPIPGVICTFYDAGHILGSAAVALDIEENGRKYRFWFSGDIGRENLPLMRDPEFPDKADYLMMECTYGDKPHRDPELAYQEFRQVVQRTVERGGKVIIPAFAVGRTQEIVYSLNRMISEGALSPLPVYVDSPLAVAASQVFQTFSSYFDEEAQQFIKAEHHPALNFDGLVYTKSVDESKAINDKKGPLIIISASGMAETGRILHHLRNNIEDPKNTIMIVSWQSPETLGRRLAERQKQVNIFGEPYTVRAEVSTIGGLSAHAGQNMLLKYIRQAKQNGEVRKIFLVHGEEKAESVLAGLMDQEKLGPYEFPAWHQIANI